MADHASARGNGVATGAATTPPHAARLQAVATALAGAATPAEVAHATVQLGLMAAGAATGSVAALARGRRGGDAAHELELLAAAGLDSAWEQQLARIPLDAPLPLAEAARQREAVWVEGRDRVAARYPEVAARPELGNAGLVAMPLVVPADGGARVVGALGASFPEPRMLDAGERAYLETLAGLAARALARAWLYADEQVARREAEEANRAKTQFLATMSHELRTPLNAIQGHVQLVELGIHGDVTDAQLDALQRVQRAQRHLRGLIDDILDYARIEGGRVEYDVHAVPLSEVVRDAVAMVEPQLAEKAITLDIARATDLAASRVRAWADREKLVQVLLNLLSNAIKFTDAGGRVTLEVESRADGGAAGLALVRVRDTGVGIPADKLETIFDPFVQVRHGTYTPGAGGTGLGLAISRDLARGMGGDLRVQSVVGVGSTFTVGLRGVGQARGDEGEVLKNEKADTIGKGR